MLRATSEQTVVARPKGRYQCVPTESDAPLKGSWFMRGPRSPFRVSGSLSSVGCWGLSGSGGDVRLNCVPLLPIEFDISLDGFRTTLAGLMWRDRDIAGIAFRPTTTANSNCS